MTIVIQLNGDLVYKELTNEFDLNNALGKYRTDSSVIIASLKNKPSEIRNSGETTLDWYPANERNTYGIQIMRWTFGNTHMIFTRNKTENTWAEWVQYATKSDLQKQIITTSVIDFASSFNGHIALLYYNGTDYSWLPRQDRNYIYGFFTVECSPVAKKITATSWSGGQMATKVYNNGAWQDWIEWVSK